MAEKWSSLLNLLEEGLEEGVYTAAAALVGLEGELRWEGYAGRLSREARAPAVDAGTVFDLASLTKPLAMAPALMLLVDRGRVALDTSLGEILPREWLPPDKGPLTLGSLLAHQARFPAWRPFFEEVLAAPAAVRPTLLERLAAAAPREYAPEGAPEGPGQTLYSDLGYMLLKAVVEELSGQDLDRFCRGEIYRPLGLDTLGFNPRRQPGGEDLNYAATETGLIPGRNISGEVHDENAWAAGGVAGHAGLFGPGREVFALLAALYRTYRGQARGPFRAETVRLFLTPVPGGGRALGFDTPNAEAAPSAAGRYFSPLSVGHLGFTGTSFWLDLKLGQMVVLLTNRVHLGRNNEKIRAFRPRFQEAASQALGFTRAIRQ